MCAEEFNRRMMEHWSLNWKITENRAAERATEIKRKDMGVKATTLKEMGRVQHGAVSRGFSQRWWGLCASRKQRHWDVQLTGSWNPAPHLHTEYDGAVRWFSSLDKRERTDFNLPNKVRTQLCKWKSLVCVCSLLQPDDCSSVNDNLFSSMTASKAQAQLGNYTDSACWNWASFSNVTLHKCPYLNLSESP